MKLEQTKLVDKVWQNLPKKFILKSKMDLIILASMVQKESSSYKDSQLVASVFINRLIKKMRLQSDVTLAYGLNINGKEITVVDGVQHHKPIEKLRIGKSDLGNWSKPINQGSIRSLNGRIDEFGIFSVVLSSDEIADIYNMGKPNR